MRSPKKPRSSTPLKKAALTSHLEHAQQQLSLWQAQLAQDATQIESYIENTESPSISVGYRIAIRGTILTDLRRMLDEVHDIVALTSRSSPHDPLEEQSAR
jgi:hypothetical protein